MSQIRYRWTNGQDADFQRFYSATEEYYSSIVGGVQNHRGFVPYNISENIACVDDMAVGCVGLKKYSEKDAEIKRVWVEPEYRRQYIAEEMMKMLEELAIKMQFQRTVLQNREAMREAVSLYGEFRNDAEKINIFLLERKLRQQLGASAKVSISDSESAINYSDNKRD